jgi:hypothetical protein
LLAFFDRGWSDNWPFMSLVLAEAGRQSADPKALFVVGRSNHRCQ